MRIIVEIGHPAHVHLFRHVIQSLIEHGHEIQIVARDKDVTLSLLNDFGLEYVNLSQQGNGTIGMLVEMLYRDMRLYRIAKSFQPDIFLSLSMCSSHVAKLLGKISIIFDDTENAKLERFTWKPFATYICTPDCYKLDLGKRHIRFNGYHELAYLHPRRFSPDPRTLNEIGLTEGDKFFIVRFVSWRAGHDSGQFGFSYHGKMKLISELEKIGRVIITSESKLPPDFESYRLDISPTKLHDLLFFSSLYIGEGATMASEAAMLGTPCIYVNSITAGTLEEQESRFGLLHRILDEEKAIDAAKKLALSDEAKEKHLEKRQILLKEKIDVTAWIVDFVESVYFKGSQ